MIPEQRATKPFKCFVCQRDVITAPPADAIAESRGAEEGMVAAAEDGSSRLTLPAKSARAAEEPPEPLPAFGKMESAYSFAAEQMEAGVSGQEVERQLVEQGLDSESAQQVVEELREARNEALRQAGQKNVLFGGLWCGGGIPVTVATYYLAANLGASKYVIAWGAIVFGAIQLIRGLYQLSRQE